MSAFPIAYQILRDIPLSAHMAFRVESLSALETVAIDTPARRATSAMPGGRCIVTLPWVGLNVLLIYLFVTERSSPSVSPARARTSALTDEPFRLVSGRGLRQDAGVVSVALSLSGGTWRRVHCRPSGRSASRDPSRRWAVFHLPVRP